MSRAEASTLSERAATHAAVSAAFAQMDDAELTRAIEAAEPLGVGIGGQTLRLDVGGVPVFAKRVPLTAREISGGETSTANVFGLPTVCHYGIGGPGFGAGREVVAHEATTAWVLDGTTGAFPLLYHRRVLPGVAAELPEELRDAGERVRYWGSATVGERIEELRTAPAAVWLFLEYLPQTLFAWLSRERAIGAQAFDRALEMVERELLAAARAMAGQGFVHLDAHFDNILTDGEHLYLGDLGLALWEGFALDADERAFLDEHADYDRSYVMTYLVRVALGESGVRPADHLEVLTRVLAGESVADAVAGVAPGASPGLTAGSGRLVRRYAEVVVTSMTFHRDLAGTSRATPYPQAAVREAWDRVGPAGSGRTAR